MNKSEIFNKIDSLNNKINNQTDRINKLEDKIRDKDFEINKTKKTIRDNDSEINKLNTKIDEKKCEICRLNNKIRDYNFEINNLKISLKLFKDKSLLDYIAQRFYDESLRYNYGIEIEKIKDLIENILCKEEY